MLFLLSCIMSKTDLAAQLTPAGNYSTSVRQHALLFEFLGPSATADFASDRYRFAVGGDLGLGSIMNSLCDGGELCTRLGPSFRYSVIGIQLAEYQQIEGAHHFGFLSPYMQLHAPFGCKNTDPEKALSYRDPEPCLSLFGSVEYQNILQAPNEVVFGIGLSYSRIIY